MSSLTFDRTTRRVCTEINIINDGVEEQNESFLLLLVTSQSHTVSLKPQSAIVTITESGCKLTTFHSLCSDENGSITCMSFCSDLAYMVLLFAFGLQMMFT